jgi:hypothetical protein
VQGDTVPYQLPISIEIYRFCKYESKLHSNLLVSNSDQWTIPTISTCFARKRHMRMRVMDGVRQRWRVANSGQDLGHSEIEAEAEVKSNFLDI